ncbi:fatty acyl-AMP ligase [Amycolatopsis sp. A133]|uniref:fatty acyl-AMP ligase n=1 Tax=Amycolatopsis sp. A133 TaxID=3064472 RepID=UPI0027E99B88|nr:fatty acyl-AMP ligase [Amycolatopsis sp. A133]MDQ7805119.1 fatty acyl-AMP ligase [Amycolatopsis sp. A133]
MPPAAVPEDVLATPFTDYLLRNAAEDRPAFTRRTFPGPADHTLTWPQLLARVRGVARELRRFTRPGDRVAIVARQDLDYVVAFLGTLYAGLIAVPLSVPTGRTHRARIEAAFADATPAVCLTSKDLVDKVPPTVVLAIEDIQGIEPGDAEPPATVAMTDPAYLQYTSGSTRRPAGAVISHRALVAGCWQTTRCYRAGASTPLVGWVPFFHDMGLVLLIATPVFLGSRSVFCTPVEFVRDPLRWIRLLAEHPGAVTAAPNFAFDLAAEAAGELAGVDLSQVNSLLNGSEPIRAATVENFARAFAPFGLPRAAQKPAYGLAEATVFVTSAGAEGPTVRTFDGGEPRVSVGRPYGQRIRIVDKEIQVAGPNVADGYWGRDDVIAPDGWLRTGDLGFVHDGELYVTGRLKDLIIVDGRNHHPQDIEATVEAAHPSIRRVAAFAVRDGDGEGVAVVAGCTAPDEPVETAVRRAVSAAHDLPLRALWLVRPGEVPRTSSGKVSRAAARERWWGENERHG